MYKTRILIPFVLIFASLFFMPTNARADCAATHSAAAKAQTYAQRALKEINFSDAQSSMLKARNTAEEAYSEAQKCKCDRAEDPAARAYAYARGAYDASSLRELHYYASRAMKSADIILDAVSSCEKAERP